MVFNSNSHMATRSQGVSKKQNTTNFGKERIRIHKCGGKLLGVTDVLPMSVVNFTFLKKILGTYYGFRRVIFEQMLCC